MYTKITKMLIGCTILVSVLNSSLPIASADNSNLQAQVHFIAGEGGHLVHNNDLKDELTKTFSEDTLLKDITPEVKANDNFKFRGWFTYKNEKETEKVTITDTLKVDNNQNYHALFYKDINDNNIDDITEKITLKFVPNNEEQINDLNLHVGQSFTLPTLSEKNGYKLAGWYLDRDFKTKYNVDSPLLKDTILYAKWENEEVEKENETNPYTTQDIVAQLEKLFDSRFDGFETNIDKINERINSLSNDDSNSQPLAINPPQTVEQPQEETQSQTVSSQTATQPLVTDQSQTVSPQQSEVLTYTEPKYVFENTNVGQKFEVKIYNENDKFLDMLELPYGHTVRLLTQEKKLVKEYVVRQNTKIIMNTTDYMSNVVDEILEIKSRVIIENDSKITEIFPSEIITIDDSVLTDINKEAKEESNSQAIVLMVLGVLSILSFVVAAIILFFKKRKHKNNKEVDVHIDSIQKKLK